MKTILLFFTVVFLTSCETELTPEISSDTELEVIYRKAITPVNNNNPYDASGQVFDAIFDLYYLSGDSLPKGTENICSRIEYLASGNALFQINKTFNYQPIQQINVDDLLTNTDSILHKVTAELLISPQARDSIKSFVGKAIFHNSIQDNYADFHTYIINYEDEVIKNIQYSAAEKQIILTVSSIMRYSAFRAKKKPKKNTDPEWDLLIGHVSGAVRGAPHSVNQAATLALATAIAENNP